MTKIYNEVLKLWDQRRQTFGKARVNFVMDLDADIKAWRGRPLEQAYPYLIIDADHILHIRVILDRSLLNGRLNRLLGSTAEMGTETCVVAIGRGAHLRQSDHVCGTCLGIDLKKRAVF